MGKTAKQKPKRNKLSQRRLKYKKEQKEWMQQQRYKAWMLHEMIDEDLRNLKPNTIKDNDESQKNDQETTD